MLEVRSGPSAGKGVRLQSGQSIRIGRTAKSDFALPSDDHISGLHFEVELTETECRLRDLKSTNGTLLNGQRINEALLQHGDTIVAGETSFSVVVAAEAGSPTAAEPIPAIYVIPQQRLLAVLRNHCQPLYAILDAARDTRILALLVQSKEEHESLYEGVEGAKLAQVAPYLVRLAKDSLLLGSLVLEGWGNSWGVYLTCDGDFHQVRRHLRHFLEVQLPGGKQVYFRFYDPRVLRVFLPTCTPDETNQFFGPIKHYLMEDEEPDKLLQFANAGHGVDKKMITLLPPDVGERTIAEITQDPTSPWPQKAVGDSNAG